MRKFQRRTYPSFTAFWKDFRELLARRREIRETMRGGMISPPFRERLMLAVTSVNKCRYCSYAHTRRALMEGIPHDEIRELDGGTFRRSPADELPALLYAQHWSENSGVPEPEARAKLIETYGLEKTQAIELSLRLIQMGNLMGNTFDLFLNRISFGRWGLTDEEGGIRLADESDV